MEVYMKNFKSIYELFNMMLNKKEKKNLSM
jgi:hypothetical protein